MLRGRYVAGQVCYGAGLNGAGLKRGRFETGQVFVFVETQRILRKSSMIQESFGDRLFFLHSYLPL